MDKILIGKGEHSVNLLAKYGNRHGLIAGRHRDRQDSFAHGAGGRLLASGGAGVPVRR